MLDNFGNNQHSRSNRFLWLFLGLFLALAVSNLISPYLSNIFTGILSGIAPIFLAAIVAFLCYRFIDFIEKKILKKAFKNSKHTHAWKRTISLVIVTLLLVGIITLVVYILVPKVIEVIKELIGPGSEFYIERTKTEIEDFVMKYFGAEVTIDISGIISVISDYITSSFSSLSDVLAISSTVISGIFTFVTGLFFAVLMMKDKEKITGYCRRYAYANFKRDRADEMCVIAKKSNDILFNYFVSKFFEFAILFALLGFVFMILDVKYAWELSLIIAIFNFIPYFGVIIGLVPAVLIVTVFNSLTLALYMILYTAIIVIIITSFVTPFIMGSKIKVSGLVVACSILIGGSTMGMFGMLFAPPVVSIISVVLNENMEIKENKAKYLRELREEREKQRQLEEAENAVPEPETNETEEAKQTVEEEKKDKNEDNKEIKEEKKDKEKVQTEKVAAENTDDGEKETPKKKRTVKKETEENSESDVKKEKSKTPRKSTKKIEIKEDK